MDYAQLRNLDTSNLVSAASTSGELSGSLSKRGGEVASKSDIPTGMWQGADAGAASSLLSPQSQPLYDISDSASRAQGVLQDLVASLDSAKGRLDDAHTLAAAHGLSIGDDGSVHTPTPGSEDPETYREIAEQVAAIIDRALEQARQADDISSRALERIDQAVTNAGNALTWTNIAHLMIDDRQSSGTLSNINKWVGRGGNVLSFATAGLAQAEEDWNRDDLSNAERVTRTGYASLVEGTLSTLGSAGGTAIGQAGGYMIGGPLGAAVGGFVGGQIFGRFGGATGGLIVDNTVDAVGEYGDGVWERATYGPYPDQTWEEWRNN